MVDQKNGNGSTPWTFKPATSTTAKPGHDRHQDDCRNHGHPPGHSHQHAIGHHHSTMSNLGLALALNLAFSLLEIGGGLWSGSVAVLSNAVHDLSDALAIAVAFIMEHVGNKRSNSLYSYGYRRLSLLSALFTCALLVAASAAVLAHAIPLLAAPPRPRLSGMVGFAFAGVIANGYAALRLARGRTMNEKVVSWHMLEDVLGWSTVLIGAIILAVFDLPIIDPILSILSSMLILWGGVRNLHRTLKLFLQATPEGVDLGALRREIESLPDVLGTHDAHLWSLDGQAHVLTLHVVVKSESSLKEAEGIKDKIRQLVAQRGRIHVTVETESHGGECPAVDCVHD